MDFVLVTTDTNLARLCRDLLSSVAGRNWTLMTCDPGDPVPAADLYLWDFDSERSPKSCVNPAANHLFLVHSRDLDTFRAGLGDQDSNILLKPVTRAVLSAYLALAVQSNEECQSRADSLRADRDEMLQCLIQANLRLQEYECLSCCQ